MKNCSYCCIWFVPWRRGLTARVTAGPPTSFLASSVRLPRVVNSRIPERCRRASVRAGSTSRLSSTLKGMGVLTSSSFSISEIHGHRRESERMMRRIPPDASFIAFLSRKASFRSWSRISGKWEKIRITLTNIEYKFRDEDNRFDEWMDGWMPCCDEWGWAWGLTPETLFRWQYSTHLD